MSEAAKSTWFCGEVVEPDHRRGDLPVDVEPVQGARLAHPLLDRHAGEARPGRLQRRARTGRRDSRELAEHGSHHARGRRRPQGADDAPDARPVRSWTGPDRRTDSAELAMDIVRRPLVGGLAEHLLGGPDSTTRPGWFSSARKKAQ